MNFDLGKYLRIIGIPNILINKNQEQKAKKKPSC